MLVFALSALTYVVGIVLIVLVVMQRKEPTSTLAWILTIVFLPILGALLYVWFGFGRIERRVRRRQRSNERLAPSLHRLERTLMDFKIVPENSLQKDVQADLLKVTENIGAFPVTRGNAIALLTNPKAAFQQLEEAIENAQDSIHMQYYIFRRDATGKRIRDLLIKAAKRGVEVRLLVDGVGSWSLGDLFTIPFKEARAKFARYLPVTFLGRPWHWNLRNHRKITIVDGTTGYIGSLNIGNEYRERTGKTTDFYDYQVKCEGPVVQQLQETFAGDWFFATGENLLQERYFPVPVRQGTVPAQIVAGGPDQAQFTLHAMICAAIQAARRSVKIMTPYLIPDQSLLTALHTGALRGVRVELLLPRHMHTFHEQGVRTAGRSYYDELLSCGIHLYEYLPGFLHRKSIIIDSTWASVGTANMDIRSFRLNFEVNLNLYSPEITSVLEKNFEETKKECEEIRLEEFRKRPLSAQFLENILRVLSPIL
jgi:cardiolipin synthase